MKETIKKGANDYYCGKTLSPEQMEALQAMEGKIQRSERTSIGKGFLSMKTIFILPLVGLFAFLIVLFSSSELTLTQEIASEIAYNHLKSLDSEIQTDQIEDIRSYLDKLDFYIRFSQRFEENDWSLMGARYCSINKKLAAQIRIRNNITGEIHTWYQVNSSILIAPEDLKNEVVMSFNEGVKVVVWQENGILHGLAGGK